MAIAKTAKMNRCSNAEATIAAVTCRRAGTADKSGKAAAIGAVTRSGRILIAAMAG
jgi:hypothetical protein